MGIFSRSKPDFETLKEDLERQTRTVKNVLAECESLETEIKTRFREVEERLDGQEKTVRLMAEEMEERIDRGNKVWRKIRASEYYERQREDSEEDEEPDLFFSPGNGESGDEEGMQAMYPHLGRLGRPPSKAQAMGKTLARRLAGLD